MYVWKGVYGNLLRKPSCATRTKLGRRLKSGLRESEPAERSQILACTQRPELTRKSPQNMLRVSISFNNIEQSLEDEEAYPYSISKQFPESSS